MNRIIFSVLAAGMTAFSAAAPAHAAESCAPQGYTYGHREYRGRGFHARRFHARRRHLRERWYGYDRW